MAKGAANAVDAADTPDRAMLPEERQVPLPAKRYVVEARPSTVQAAPTPTTTSPLSKTATLATAPIAADAGATPTYVPGELPLPASVLMMPDVRFTCRTRLEPSSAM